MRDHVMLKADWCALIDKCLFLKKRTPLQSGSYNFDMALFLRHFISVHKRTWNWNWENLSFHFKCYFSRPRCVVLPRLQNMCRQIALSMQWLAAWESLSSPCLTDTFLSLPFPSVQRLKQQTSHHYQTSLNHFWVSCQLTFYVWLLHLLSQITWTLTIQTF